MEEIKVAFIGCGAMGGAMARAVCRSNKVKADVVVTAAHYENAVSFAETNNCRAAKSNREAVLDADIVFIAVKPQTVGGVIGDIRRSLKDGAVVVSMAAGVDLNMLRNCMGYADAPIARIMPNVGANVGQSMTAFCCNEYVTEAQKALLVSLLECAGMVREVNESLMPIVTAVSGSGPAFVFMFIEAMADAAVRGGMKRADAYTFAEQTVLGSAALALQSDLCPAALKDSVCSPAGTTIEGVAALERGGMRSAVMCAVAAAFKKALPEQQ